jgi:hypothetical protein
LPATALTSVSKRAHLYLFDLYGCGIFAALALTLFVGSVNCQELWQGNGDMHPSHSDFEVSGAAAGVKT